jgi:Cof subfamily protein (haloacid dehalogenase superfamily)
MGSGILIKAVFFDLDGTLLDEKKVVTLKTRAALERCKAEGVRLFLATGRPPLLEKMLSWDIQTCALFDGGVFYNGGCVIVDGKKEYGPVSEDAVRDIMGLLAEREDMDFLLQLEDEKHAFRYPLDPRYYNLWGVTAADVLPLEQADPRRVVKIMAAKTGFLFSLTAIDPGLVVQLQSVCEGKAQFYLTDQGRIVQIVGRDVHKLSGVEKIRNALGLEKNEIAVLGDDWNDVEMLAAYPVSVAMGNAEERVRGAAQFVTADNEHDGVAYAIQNILHL